MDLRLGPLRVVSFVASPFGFLTRALQLRGNMAGPCLDVRSLRRSVVRLVTLLRHSARITSEILKGGRGKEYGFFPLLCFKHLLVVFA